MIGIVSDICRRHKIIPGDGSQPRPLSAKAWLIEDETEDKWVIKFRPAENKASEVLTSFPFLHHPFRYPRLVSGPDDLYLIYPYVQGEPLTESPYEEPQVIARVMEIIGRMQALMQSLALVPFYKDTLNLRETETDPLQQLQSRSGWDRMRSSDSRRKEDRQREIADSYRWTEARAAECSDAIKSRGLWPDAPLDEYRAGLGKSFSLHIPITGSNLAHTELHPEHLLLCPDNEMGIVGWRVESRPRFYMRYTYLSWCFLHSRLDDPTESYRLILNRNSSKAFFKEHHQVFAFCLMEQLEQFEQLDRSATGPATESFPLPQSRMHQAQELFSHCVRSLPKESQEGTGL
jgi:hypothetical protein